MLNGEYSFLAEDIDTFCQLLLRYQGEHLADVKINKCIFPALPLRRDSMCAHKSGYHIHRMSLIEPPHHTQLLQLGLPVEPIAALALHGGDAQLKHRIETLTPRHEQLLFRRCPRGVRRVDDASTALHDLHIAVTPHPP